MRNVGVSDLLPVGLRTKTCEDRWRCKPAKALRLSNTLEHGAQANAGQSELSLIFEAIPGPFFSERILSVSKKTREVPWLEGTRKVLVSAASVCSSSCLASPSHAHNIRFTGSMSGTQQPDSSAASDARFRPSAAGSSSQGRKVSFEQLASTSSSRASSSAVAAPGASGSTSSLSAYSGATRRHSLFGTEDRIILDVGSRYSKFGFSGEPRPRAIVPSVSFSQPSTSYLRLDASSATAGLYGAGDTLWDVDFERCADDQLRRGRRALVLAQLTQLLRSAFTQHLMTDPKKRKVLVVENPMLPNAVKDMICEVLFNNLQVPSVSFVPAPLLSLLAVGRITGLVLEVGYLEATLMPIYYGRPLASHVATTARAGQRLNSRLRRLLLRYAKFVAAHTGLQDSTRSLRERTRDVDPAMLTDERIEQIKAKALFVSSYDPALSDLADVFSVLDLDPSPARVDAGVEQEAVSTIRRKYSATSSATPFTFGVTPESVDHTGSASLIQSIQAPAPHTGSALGASAAQSEVGVIAIPGWVRERAAEVLFERGDADDSGLVEMTVAAIGKLPIDLRRVMCENLLVSGGTAMLPGFAHRFRTQLAAAIDAAEQPGGALSVDRNARRIGSTTQISQGTQRGRALSGSVAVLNDPWPETAHAAASKEAGQGQGGTAPAFAANLLPYMGASLAGALKTTSLTAISREAYDEATNPVMPEAKVEAAGGDDKETRAGEGAKASRPGMLGAMKRGSFVGVVGGLETGAYGGLAAVSRHLVGMPGTSTSSDDKTS